MGAFDGRLPQATLSSPRRSSEVSHKELPRLRVHMVASYTFGELRHELAQDEESFATRVRASKLHEQLQRQLENTTQGSKSIDEYFKEMKIAL